MLKLTCRCLQGARVILTSRNVEAGQKVADEIKAGGAKVRSLCSLDWSLAGKQYAAAVHWMLNLLSLLLYTFVNR